MSLFSKIKSAVSTTVKSAGDIFNNQTWTPFSLGRADSNTATLMNANKNWVFVCVDTISSSLSGIELKLMRQTADDKADEQLFSHPILDLLSEPNSFLDGRELMYHTHGHSELVGNAYWRKVDKQLIPVPPQNVTVKIAADGLSVSGYEIKTNTGGKINVPAEEIYHYRYPNLDNPFVGVGTAAKIADWIDVEKFATEFNRNFFENGGEVGDVLETQATTREEIELIRKGWEMKHRGMSNAHNAAILPNGTKLNKGGQSMRDMQFSELDNRYRDKILAAFGVPKSILGITESGMSRADAEAKNYSFAFFTLEPKMRRFVEWLNNTVIKDLDPTGLLYIDFDSIVPADKTHELESIKAGVANQAYMTLNEARERDGLSPVDGGDIIPQPQTFAPFGTPSKAINKKKRITRSSVATKNSTADDIAALVKDVAVISQKAFTDDEDKEYHKSWTKKVNRAEPIAEQLTADLIDFNAQQARRARKWARENIKEGKGIETKKALNVLNKSDEMALTIELMSPALTDLLQREGDAAIMSVNPMVKFDVNADATQERFDKYVGAASGSYTETTIAALNDTIKEGIAAGENVKEIEKRINEVYDYTDKVRAELMAKTTTFDISNQATNDAFVQSGVVKTKKWYTAQDERVCPMCAPLHAKEVSVEATFYKEGDHIAGGSPSASAFLDMPWAPLHPRCRCTVVAGEIDYGKAQTEVSEKELDGEEKFLTEMLSVLEQNDYEK